MQRKGTMAQTPVSEVSKQLLNGCALFLAQLPWKGTLPLLFSNALHTLQLFWLLLSSPSLLSRKGKFVSQNRERSILRGWGTQVSVCPAKAQLTLCLGIINRVRLSPQVCLELDDGFHCNLSSGACHSQGVQSSRSGELLQSTISKRPESRADVQLCLIWSFLVMCQPTEIPLTGNDWTPMKGNPELSQGILILWLEGVKKEVIGTGHGKTYSHPDPWSYTTVSNSNSVYPPTSNTSTHENLPFPGDTHILIQEV